MKNPRLKNLLMLSKALTTVSDCVQNLSVEDIAEMGEKFGCIPVPNRCEAMSDWLNERITETTINDTLPTSMVMLTTVAEA